MPPLVFQITHRSAANRARLGRLTTPHGAIDTPAFMPVGTQGTIKGILPDMVRQLGAQVILANTFHLMLRPGSELVAEMGGREGLHDWMRWDGPILTDSGGFQVFSLADLNQIGDDGVTFRSPHDGRSIHLTPERSIQVQNELGADIIMAFDDCPPARGEESSELRVPGSELGEEELASGIEHSVSPTRNSELGTRNYLVRVRQACERSIRWLERCVRAHARPDDQALFGIIQGGTDLEQRSWCAAAVLQHDLPGYAIGGVAVGEGFEELKRVVEHTAPLLPEGKPRYLMGVGYERDILTAVQAGVDMFDCVLPTRNGRNANAFTPAGQMRLRNAKYTNDPRPIDETCDCVACGALIPLPLREGLGEGRAPNEPRGPIDPKRCEAASGETNGRPPNQPRGPIHPVDATLPPPLPKREGSKTHASGSACSRSGFSRSYLRHLFMAGEMLGPILVTLHNLRHFQRFMLDIRTTIVHDDWSALLQRWPVAAGRMKCQ